MRMLSKSFFLKDSVTCCPIDFYLHPLQRPSHITQPEVSTCSLKKILFIVYFMSYPNSFSLIKKKIYPQHSSVNPCPSRPPIRAVPLISICINYSEPSHITQPELGAPTRVTNKAADEDKCRPFKSISLSMPHQLGLPGFYLLFKDDSIYCLLCVSFCPIKKKVYLQHNSANPFSSSTPIRAVPLISICIHYSDLLTSPSQKVRAPTRVTNKAADEDKCRPCNSISPSMPHQLGLPGVRRNVAVKN
ncbi:hypothetical protein CDAR_173081 [Caerostris darwini]|uniref:Uncharacterized protein n=1 Tax=Caerostris darwini TaxID=1538125 RepID=A0AAV4WHA9_9ARAC|nr:hypothetical protein CDAR_173081 [Caerostris darwini]